MIRAELRDIHCSDADPLETWVPYSDDWGLPFEMSIGSVGSSGADIFQVLVCSPAWIVREAREGAIVDGRHHLIVASYDFDRLHAYLRGRVSQVQGATWGEVAERLARFARWEFEDYRR